MLMPMMKLWKDGLFLFAVVAGLVYECVYETMRSLAGHGVRATASVTTGTWRRIVGTS